MKAREAFVMIFGTVRGYAKEGNVEFAGFAG